MLEGLHRGENVKPGRRVLSRELWSAVSGCAMRKAMERTT